MADRYWVAGGTGNYNSTTNWSATSGGASGASVPSGADNVFFDGNSGAGTATINVASDCANLNLTGFTGTLTFTNNLTVNSTAINFGTGGYTVTGAGFLIYARVNATFSITSGGTIWAGNMRIGNLQPTINFVDDFSITGTLELASGGVTTFNGSTIFVGGNLTILNSGSGNFFTGTTAIVFNGTGTWSHLISAVQIRNNTTINTTGTLTISGNVYYNTGTFTYTAGTVVTTGSTLNINGATTFNTAGMSWNNIAITAGTQTLNSLFSVNGTMTLSISTIFAGTAGFSVATLTVSAAGLTHQLVSTVTYTINTAFTCTAATDASRVLFRSTIAASKAILTLSPGATNNLRFVNATDIDSSSGRTIYSYRGVFSNTDNWSLLPTEPTANAGAFTFIN